MEIKAGSKDFKILYLSNAPFIPSGYGVQCAGNCYEWVKHYDVRVLANYGVQGRMIGLNNLPIYAPLTGDPHGNRSANLIFKSWNPDVFITLYDIWMGAYVTPVPPPQMFKPIHPHWIVMVMVDHEPIPDPTLIQAQCAYKIVVPTKYGVEQFRIRGIIADYIPFGIDTNIFKPLEDKAKLRTKLNNQSVRFNIDKFSNIDEDSFVIMMCGANKDPFRKAFMRGFIGVQLFLDANPDAKRDTRVYVHSWMVQARDIPRGARTLHIEEYCRGTADYHMLCGMPETTMAELYNAADVFLHPSQGGGFEIPILEALSSGVPVIGSDFIGMTELIKDHGWLIPAKTKYFSPLDALQIIVDEYKIADALEDAYNHPEKRRKFGDAGRKFAEGFDWSIINPMWYELFEGMRDKWRTKPLGERRL